MNRLTKLEIQRVLLAGREIAWTNAAGRREAIGLTRATQRRLFAYLLQSAIREPKGLPDLFVSGLSTVHAAGDDPAAVNEKATSTALTGPWRLQKIEAEGFGGLNTCNGPIFSYRLDGDSLIFQGPNGSGKSSLVGAIIWALAGERPRDYATARPEDRADVYDDSNHKIGTWPPIACYPNEPGSLASNPFVRVALTFIAATGATALVERRLENGLVSSSFDAAFSVPEVLIETGLLMPSRMPQIRFEKGQTPLTRAVQSLTGLDDLISIGSLVDSLCHKGREYLSANEKQVQHYRTLFDTALEEAQRSIKPTGAAIEVFEPQDTDDTEGRFAQLGKKLRARATELTQVISHDLSAGLDLTKADVQVEIAGAIAVAQDELAVGLDRSTSWTMLSKLGSVLNAEIIDRLLRAVEEAEAKLAEAIVLHERAQSDTRFQLKALAAHWHEANHGATELIACPLCEKPLEHSALAREIQGFRQAGEMAARQLGDNLNAIQAGLTTALPTELAPNVAELALFVPRQRLLSELKVRLTGKPRVKSALATFIRLAEEVLAVAPTSELPPPEPPTSTSETIGRVRTQIAAVRRLLSLEQWRSQNAKAWQNWWSQNVTRTNEVLLKEDVPNESLVQHLARLANAIGQAAPYRAAADALGRAWQSGREASRYEKMQAEREAIATQLAPLKSLSGLAEAQARLAIETLSSEISTILKRMHLSERLIFKNAKLERKAGLQVQGGFAEDIKIDATLVANTSWLRAVLWAFLFAMRAEAVKQLGSDSLPLLVLDDPQSTFDAEHRLRWALEIVSLQQTKSPTQVILVTHDETFVEIVKNVDGIVGREGIIVSASAELGHVGLFEGAALARKWAQAQIDNTHNAAQTYISETRIYIEGLLRLMLRGQAADVVWATNGFVMGDARDKIRELHTAKLAPWDKSEFKTLVGKLERSIAAVKYLEMSHHAGRVNLTMAEAIEVEAHWRSNIENALRRAFSLARDHFLINGGLRALHAVDAECKLPEGYTSSVKSLRLKRLGRAAALTGGLAADGRVELDFDATDVRPIVLGRHFAFRLTAPTLEPVARNGDILLVREVGEPTPKSLVVTCCADRVIARRFEVADNHSDIAVLTAHAVNPRQIAQPVVAKRSTLRLHKIIGVLFSDDASLLGNKVEVSDCGGESVINRYETKLKGLVDVSGQSAEPIALDGQMLMIGDALSPDDALARFEGRPVIAGDADRNRYFKRLRRGGQNTIVLESMEISGDFPPVILPYKTGSNTDLQEVWPVYGVLFELL